MTAVSKTEAPVKTEKTAHVASFIIGCVLVSGSLILFFQTNLGEDDSDGVYFLSRILLGLVCVLAAVSTYEAWTRLAAEKNARLDLSGHQQIFVLLAMCVAYIELLQTLGFFSVSLVFFLVTSWLCGYRRIVPMVLIGVAFVAGVWFLFSVLFNILLPTGTLMNGMLS